jgi:hypothetical protein
MVRTVAPNTGMKSDEIVPNKNCAGIFQDVSLRCCLLLPVALVDALAAWIPGTSTGSRILDFGFGQQVDFWELSL